MPQRMSPSRSGPTPTTARSLPTRNGGPRRGCVSSSRAVSNARARGRNPPPPGRAVLCRCAAGVPGDRRLGGQGTALPHACSGPACSQQCYPRWCQCCGAVVAVVGAVVGPRSCFRSAERPSPALKLLEVSGLQGIQGAPRTVLRRIHSARRQSASRTCRAPPPCCSSQVLSPTFLPMSLSSRMGQH